MEKFLKRPRVLVDNEANCSSTSSSPVVEFNPDAIISDPGIRKPIGEFDINLRDRIRREYISRGPCQPVGHSFPQILFGPKNRGFLIKWCNTHNWLEYSKSKDLGSLAKKMIATGKSIAFPLVYRLIEMALLLPVATASVERAFSAMKIVKTDLRNRMSDDWLNDCLVVFCSKDIFVNIDNEDILDRFQAMTERRCQLPPRNRRSK